MKYQHIQLLRRIQAAKEKASLTQPELLTEELLCQEETGQYLSPASPKCDR